MLRKILDAYDGRLPSDIAVVYANTGMERPETLDFVDTCAAAWSVTVHWVEYNWDAPHRTRVVDFATASRNCTLCMLKGRAKLIRLIREDPTLADWWIEQEARVANRTGPDGRACESMKRFRLGETYAELKAAALAHRDLFDDGPPAPDGNAEADSFDCHCTD